MRIGIKPGQIGLTVAELQQLWREAEAAGFESIWTFDHLTGPLCYEAVSLLAVMAAQTSRARIGCLVLAHGLRAVESLASQLATVDALSGGRLEAGYGAASQFAKQDFDALGLPFPPWPERVASYERAVERLLALTSGDSPLGARPVQTPLPVILGGASAQVRQLAIDRGLAWNLSSHSPAEFSRLKAGQPDPQAQVFMREVESVPEIVAAFREAGATRLVFVLEPPVTPADIRRVAREAGL
jgi:alkanesulfonate monooxygenase SsuD/methylene tetrahydromethanopterin reductase-like flavin-dependent oxidoreductase (luciferase family)